MKPEKDEIRASVNRIFDLSCADAELKQAYNDGCDELDRVSKRANKRINIASATLLVTTLIGWCLVFAGVSVDSTWMTVVGGILIIPAFFSGRIYDRIGDKADQECQIAAEKSRARMDAVMEKIR